jgi:acetyl esterase/lipase
LHFGSIGIGGDVPLSNGKASSMEMRNVSAREIIQANAAIGEKGFIHICGGDPAAPKPFVLGIHGGGWRNGEQKSYEWLWSRVKPLGVALALPSYRLAPAFRFPSACDDLLHCLAWLREKGAAQGLDASRCVMLGGSAGGHWVMLLATRAMREGRPMPAVRGVVNYCGIMDLAEQAAHDTSRGSTMVKDFLGGPAADFAELCRAASPACHVHREMPPVWMAHGSADGTVPVAQSREMARRLREAGHDPVYLEARGLGHTMTEVSTEGKQAEPVRLLFEEDVLRFIHRALKG